MIGVYYGKKKQIITLASLKYMLRKNVVVSTYNVKRLWMKSVNKNVEVDKLEKSIILGFLSWVVF